MTRSISQKRARFQAGGRLRVLDLFAGCGGLSLGFQAAGFEISAAVENDPAAAQSHGMNFHNGTEIYCKARDISSSPEELVAELDLGPVDEAFDVIVGGPPCQAFARVGRPKLREIDDHPMAFIRDPRARLYLDWLRYVKVCRPLAVLMENVPDVLNHGGQNVAEEICEVLETKGYSCGYTLLNASFYGVPQMRERMFLIGYHREVTDKVTFPNPTHWVDLPPGYEGSRAVALKLLRGTDEPNHAYSYINQPEARDDLPPAVTAEEAIEDLPPIDARGQLRSGELRRGARRFDKPVSWESKCNLSDFAQLMRNWPGFEAGDALMDHVIRYLPRDFELFARMNPGDQYPEAWKHAHDMLQERLEDMQKTGRVVCQGSEEI